MRWLAPEDEGAWPPPVSSSLDAEGALGSLAEPSSPRADPGYAVRLLGALADAGPLSGLTGGDVVEVMLGVRDDELDEARRQLAACEELADPVVVSRADLVAYLNREPGNVREAAEALTRLLAAAGIED